MPTMEPAEFGSIRDALNVADEIAESLNDFTTTIVLDALTYSGRAPISSLRLDTLASLVDQGQVVEVRVRSDDWTLYVRWEEEGGNEIDADGPVAQAAEQNATDLQRAIGRRDVKAILEYLAVHDAEVTLRVTNDPHTTGTHWIRSTEELIEAVNDLWFSVSRQLATGPLLLVIDDMDDSVVTTSGMTAYGPHASREPGDIGSRDRIAASDVALRRARFGDDPPPSPLVFANAQLTAGNTSNYSGLAVRVFNELTFLLAWQVLATTAVPTVTGLDIAIRGAREVQTQIAPAALGASGIADGQVPLLDLYRWVAETTEVDRVYFAQQALSLALVTDNDILSSPKPALRTAKSLYDLSRRGLVAETMAARRSARESALSTSRGAATLARDTVGKAMERAVVQVVAIGAVVVAQVRDALTPNQATVLLFLIAALCAASLAVTHLVTLKSAGEGLTNELNDLDEYRDTLSQDDVDAIRNVGAVDVAKKDLRRAYVAIWITYGVATLVAIAAAIAIFYTQAPSHPVPSELPGPSPTGTNDDSGTTTPPAGKSSPADSPTPKSTARP